MVLAARQILIGAAGIVARLVGPEGHHRVQARVDQIDPLEEQIHHLQRRDSSGGQRLLQRGDRGEVEISVGEVGSRQTGKRAPRQRRYGSPSHEFSATHHDGWVPIWAKPTVLPPGSRT